MPSLLVQMLSQSSGERSDRGKPQVFRGFARSTYYNIHDTNDEVKEMFVNFEFLGSDPIENVITCMNFKMDKVIFFGFHEIIQQQKRQTEEFLRNYCGVKKVVFLPLSHSDLQSILDTMGGVIKREVESGSHMFFDITGGESLILVAFGMLSEKYDTPIHLYDIPKNKLIELDENATKSVSTDAQKQHVRLDLNRYIALQGGVINNQLHKSSKNCKESDLNDIWKVSQNYVRYWNPFSDFLRGNFVPDSNLKVNRPSHEIISALYDSGTDLKAPQILDKILDTLGSAGILLNVKHDERRYAFQYRDENIKKCLWEGGSALEMYTYQQVKNSADDCKIGVHIDWDGVIHEPYGVDVLNEVDVLALKDNVPIFISCKSGKMGASRILHALYELETVAQRFGGKYAKKVLVIIDTIKPVYQNRAVEMGIEVRTVRGEGL